MAADNTVKSLLMNALDGSNQQEDDTRKQCRYWREELNTSIKARKKWWKQADRIVDAYLGNHRSRSDTDLTDFNLNLFHSNAKTLSDMLYGNTPKIDVSRRYAQPDDDPARVAAEMMERLLNLDMEDNGADMDAVFKSLLQDRLLPGLGLARVRYTYESEQRPTGFTAPDGAPEMVEQLISEDVPIEYCYWGDVLWSWARNWAQLRWIAFRSYVSQEEAAKRWDEDVANQLDYKKQTAATSSEESHGNDDENTSAWQRAEVWEIWDKTTRTVKWVSLGYEYLLQEEEDPLRLQNFWPCPPFLVANVTTRLYAPQPDYVLAQDLYNEVNKLQARISRITEAVRVVGVYNASADNLKQMFNMGLDNDLIPVENWALFGENGGISGQVEWLPLDAIVNALIQLIQLRDQTIGLLQQITGMTDVMRGELSNQYEGVGQTQEKQKFGSVRIQALQEEFATFASNLMQLKAEVIALHFNADTIVEKANMAYSPDQDLVPQAVELIKNPRQAKLRVSIRPESVAMVDYQNLKRERTEYLTALSTYMQSAAGLLENDPTSKPFLLQLLQWGMAGFKGASEIEGVFDKAIAASQKQQQNQQDKPDPEQVKLRMEMQREQQRQKADLAKIQAKAEADARLRQMDMQADIQTAHENHMRKMAEIEAGMRAKIAELRTALQADLLREKAQADSNIMQTRVSAQSEIEKDAVNAQLDMAVERDKTESEIDKIITAATTEIEKTRISAKMQSNTLDTPDED